MKDKLEGRMKQTTMTRVVVITCACVGTEKNILCVAWPQVSPTGKQQPTRRPTFDLSQFNKRDTVHKKSLLISEAFLSVERSLFLIVGVPALPPKRLPGLVGVGCRAIIGNQFRVELGEKSLRIRVDAFFCAFLKVYFSNP